MRMVRWLYRKFTIRKGISFERSNFVKAIEAIGKLALETLLSGNVLLRKRDVVKEVGQDVFDYGLLIGHEDADMLIRDETADIFVTFPHRSIQEFLGAFFFMCMLDTGRELKSLLGSDPEKAIFMTNPLFLKFCLWFCSDQNFIPFEKKKEVRQCLRNRCLKSIRSRVLNTINIGHDYPALHFREAYSSKDILWMEFLAGILLKCNTTSILATDEENPLSWILSLMDTVTCIQRGQLFNYYCGNRILLNLKNASEDDINALEQHFTKLVADPLVKLYLKNPRNIYENYRVENLKSLFLEYDNQNYCDVLPLGCHLTHVCLKGFDNPKLIHKWIMQLSDKTKSGSIPCVNILSLIECRGLGGNVRKLFASTWPELRCLNLCKTMISGTDLEFLCSACNGQKNILPKLTSLCLSLPDDTVSTKLFALPWRNLQQHFVRYPTNNSAIHKDLYNALNNNTLPNLSCLGLGYKSVNRIDSSETVSIDRFPHIDCLILSGYRVSSNSLLKNQLDYSELVITSCGPSLFEVIANSSFPLLKKLVIRDCDSLKKNIGILVDANQEDRLPQLTHLDISNNVLLKAEFKRLFDGGCTWNHLLSLNLLGNKGDDDGVIDCLYEAVNHGCLSSLQELAINTFEVRKTCWPQLKKLYLLYFRFDHLEKLVKSTNQGFLPVLHSVCVRNFYYDENSPQMLCRLSEKGVSIHQRITPEVDPFTTLICVWQKESSDNRVFP